ncbi:MAG: bifunctional metallophosphatase/5'-nucleotidase [Clostridia bacterium]|nr:bifunctional metallophosphatase/5'-nucleotidase [Clostridia bacterium]
MGRYQKLVLLHSNDMHGDFLAEDIDEKLVGGVSRLSGYINKVKSEEPNTLYCIAGDMFRGSVIDSEFRGVSTIEIMNMLAPDVVTLGNHETDYGVAHLLFLEKMANFPIVNSNLFIRTNRAHLFDPFRIIEIGGMKILFVGILTEEVIAQTKNDKLIGTFVDIGEAAREVGRICNAYNALDIDLTVLLTHIGFEEDKKLAAQLDPAWGVDVIIGGHSHTLPEKPAEVNGVLIVQAGTGTDRIGRFDIIVDTDNNCVSDYEWRTVPIDDTNCPVDPELEKLIENFKHTTDEKYSRVVTRLRRRLTHPERTRETELGNLFADALKESIGSDIALLGSGSIRNESLGAIVTLGDLVECFPYDDPVHLIRVTGAQLREMIRYMVRDEVWEGAHCEFYQLSEGLRVDYDRATHDFREFTFNGEELDPDRLYSVAMQHFHFTNINLGFGVTVGEVEKNGKARVVSTSCREIIEEYLSAHPNLDREVEGRLTVRL